MKTSRRRQRLSTAASLAAFVPASFAASTSLAATDTFVAAPSWNTPADWSLGRVPAATDALFFDHSAFGPEPTATSTAVSARRPLSFDTGAGNFAIDANASGTAPRALTLTGGTNALGTGDLIATSGTTTGTVVLGGLLEGRVAALSWPPTAPSTSLAPPPPWSLRPTSPGPAA